MRLARINALRDLDFKQLVNLARQRELFHPAYDPGEWSPDRLRLKLIDSIVDEELAVRRETPAEHRERHRELDRLEGEERHKPAAERALVVDEAQLRDQEAQEFAEYDKLLDIDSEGES